MRNHSSVACSLAALAVASAAALAGCYNPTLGDTPYLCSATAKDECPDGYFCHEFKDNPPGQQYICVKELPLDAGKPDQRILNDTERLPSKEGLIYLDSAYVTTPPAACEDASGEPNNSGSTATDMTGRTGLITGWEICYMFDIDQYAFKLAQGDSLKITVRFKHSAADIDAALVDPEGQVISSSRSETDNETVEVLAQDSVAGHYILGVWGVPNSNNPTGTGTYDLYIE